jgi:hypothetical protein
MNTQLYTTNIPNFLYNLASLIKTKNSLNLTDSGIHAENLFCAILNKAFKWNLVNANRATLNHDSFDLEDRGNEIYIQVTANQEHSKKKRSSIKSFQKRTQEGQCKKFKILFISDHVSKKVLTPAEFQGFTYDALDIPSLIREILKENTIASQLEPINKILQDEFALKLILPLTSSPIIPNLGKPILPEKSKDDLHIRRDKLLNDLFAFTQAGNGLLVGGPGEGKSYLIQELQRKYWSDNIPCYVIHIDKLASGSDDAIAEELCTTGDWLTALLQIEVNTHDSRSLLIFDAFDAAKDPGLKTALLKHIQRAIESLKEKWSILVSARTYDASKSTRLMQLFPTGDSRKMVHCRNFPLHLPDVSEIRKALRKKHAVETFDKCTPTLQEILRIPYFLILFFDLVIHSDKEGKRVLESAETEEQLLEIYWRRNVLVKTANTTFLMRLAELLSGKMRLACKRTEIAQESHSDIIDDLISSGVLGESAFGLKLSFAHNILLDYAISLYVIPEKPSDLVQKLEQSEMHPFLYRSAYIYFFGRLWRLDRDLFWKHFESIRKANTPLFRLFRLTILHYVIANLYQSPNEIFTPLSGIPIAEKSKTLWKILEASRYINKTEVPEKEYFLLQEISEQLDDVLVWDVGFLMKKAIDQAAARKNARLIRLMSKASSNYIRFALRRRKSETSQVHIDRNAMHWGMINLCLTLVYNKKTANEVFRKILDILEESDFHIPIFHHLVDNLVVISRIDARLAIDIFKRIYNHTENSDSPTYLSNDVTLTLTSNRRQDFQSSRYALERLYPTLLEKYPEEYLPLGIEIVNAAFRPSQAFKSTPQKATLRVGRTKAKLSPDHFKYLNAYDKKNDEQSFVTNIFTYLQVLADKKKTRLLRSAIRIMISKIETASFWAKLIQFISQNLPLLQKEAYALLSEKQLLTFSETYPNIPDLLRKVYPLLPSTKQQPLQRIIASIQPSDYPMRNEETIQGIRTALLACLFNDVTITTGSSKPAFDETPSPFRRADPRPPDDKASPLPAAILANIIHLREFNDDREGNRQAQLRKEDYLSYLPTAQNLFQFRATSTIEIDDLYDCDYQISRFAHLISLKPSELTQEAWSLAVSAAFFFLDTPQYRTETYQPGTLSAGRHGFSPNPRIYSTEVLLHLVNSHPSEGVISRLFALFSDNNETIRWISLQALPEFWQDDKELFWDTVSGRIPIEENAGALQIMVRSLAYLAIIAANQAEVEKLAISAFRIVAKKEERLDELFQAYAILLVLLYDDFQSTIAADLLQKSFDHKSFLSSLIFIITTFIDPYDETNRYEDDENKNNRCFQLLENILNAQFDRIGEKSVAQLNADDIQPIDTVFTQLYYTFVMGKKRSNNDPLDPNRKEALYPHLKPIFSLMIARSGAIESGFMVGHTGHHFLQLLDFFFDLDPTYILNLIATTITYSAKNNINYSQSSLQIIILLTERILTDYPELLLEKENFNSVIIILDHFADAGWSDAVDLILRLKEIF